MSKRALIYLLIVIMVLGFLVVAILIPCLFRLYQEITGQTSEPRPPDLDGCTCIEIQYLPSIKQFYGNSNLLDSEEMQYVNSLKSIVITDLNDIRVLANEVAASQYQGLDPKPIQLTEYVKITGYVDYKLKASFVISGGDLRFKNSEGFHIFYNYKFPEVLNGIKSNHLPFIRRIYCAESLKNLGGDLKKAMGDEQGYPNPDDWCDVMERYKLTRYPTKERFRWSLKCSTQREARCNYAMNPNCKPDSPADMVLLFETTDGWNQHGGPELFTFDNHDPKGGCVLLNDGTVKFIRTREELKQLRWGPPFGTATNGGPLSSMFGSPFYSCHPQGRVMFAFSTNGTWLQPTRSFEINMTSNLDQHSFIYIPD